MNSQWKDFLATRGAVLELHQVAHFGQPQTELQAAAQGTIITDLSHLGLLEVNGEDALTFLQGQITNDVKLLDGTNSHYAGYCTPKGRLLAVFLAFAHHDHFHLQLNGALTEQVLKRLRMYVLRSKVTLTDMTDSIVRIGLAGPQAKAALEGLFGTVPQAPFALVTLESAHLLRLPGTDRYEIFCAPERAPEIWKQLSQTATPVGATCWEWLEIQAVAPEVVPATLEAFVPQMVNLDLLGGISFKKGCYTGQEIVARTHYLGKVKRRTLLAHLDAAQAPVPGDAVYGTDSAEPVGQIVRSAAAPAGGFDVLAEIRLDSVAAGDVRWAAVDGPVMNLLSMPYEVQ